jgi:hypothetical protein
LVLVVTRRLLMRALLIRGVEMPIPGCFRFRGSRLSLDSSRSIEADMIIMNHCLIVDHCPVNVGVVDRRRIHSPDGGIIVKGAPFPSAAVEARSIIAKAIVDSAIESDVGTPITAMPPVVAAGITPVTRSPKVFSFRRFNPDAGNPEITVIAVGPVARNPKISIIRTIRLLVDGNWRRRNGD